MERAFKIGWLKLDFRSNLSNLWILCSYPGSCNLFKVTQGVAWKEGTRTLKQTTLSVWYLDVLPDL